MGDPRRLFDSKDIQSAALYANQITGGVEDFYPLKVDSNGYLLISMTVGSVSLSSTASVITNAPGNPVNVALSSTKVTIDNAISLSSTVVTVSNSVSTIPIVGRTLTGSSGSLTATNGSITATPTNRIKVYAISLTTTSPTEVIAVFNSGGVANGLELWRATLMAPAGSNAGLNLAVAPPNFLFASRSGTSVSLSLNSSVLVHYSISYFEEV